MSSSFQQIPVGIPATQNPYPSIPYSQNFPDEPERESSQLLNNHPQRHYPPHHVYGQQPVLMNQPGQFYGAAHGFHQQPQFMMVPIDPERIGLSRKISDIDKILDNGWYFVYKVFLYINIVGGILGLFQLSVCLLAVPFFVGEFKGSALMIVAGVILVLIGLYAWILHFSLIFKNAMNDKSLKGARRGYSSMINFSVCNLVLTIALIGVAEFILKKDLPPDMTRESWVPYYVQALVSLYAVPTFLKLFGAKKVIDLLAEREPLVHELNTRFGTNLA